MCRIVSRTPYRGILRSLKVHRRSTTSDLRAVMGVKKQAFDIAGDQSP